MKDSFVFYKSFRDALKELDPEDQVIMFNALCDYALDGTEPKLQGMHAAMFALMRPQIDANNKRYENGKKGGRPRTEPEEAEPEETEQKPNHNQKKPNNNQEKPNNNLTITKPEPNVNVNVNVNDNAEEKDTLTGIQKEMRPHFKPPDIEEVRAYAAEYARKAGKEPINAERFCDFYASKSWMIGKNKMKDWKAAVRNWTNDDSRRSRAAPAANFKQRDDSYAKMMEDGNW